MGSAARSGSLRDRVALVGAALALSVVMFSVAMVAIRMGWGRQWYVFIMLTPGLFGAVAWNLRREIRRRRRTVVHPWILIAAFGALLLLHCVAIGGVVYLVAPDWRWLEWTVLTILEIGAISFVLEAAYLRAVRPARTPRRP
jgi:hypothetical protein